MPPSEKLASLSEDWLVQATVVIVKNPPEMESGSRLIYQVLLEPKGAVAHHRVKASVTLDKSLEAWAPPDWLKFHGDTVDLGDGTGLTAQKIGHGLHSKT